MARVGLARCGRPVLPGDEGRLTGSRSILAVDVGNSLTKIARVTAESVEHLGAVATGCPPDDLARILDGIEPVPAYVCSVVVGALDGVIDGLTAGGATSTHVLGRDVPLPVTIDYDTPDTLGFDRVIAAYAAWTLHEGGAIVIDAGTAMTVDWIDSDRTFRGGAIAPGPATLGAALSQAAPALDRVDPEPMSSWPGRTTRESLVVGVTAAARGMVRDIVSVARDRAGAEVAVVVTGGAGPLVSRLLEVPHEFEPHLLVRGLGAIAGVPWTRPSSAT